MISPDDFLDTVWGGQAKGADIKLATVFEEYTTGLPMVTFDGEVGPSPRTYPTTVENLRPLDRVIMQKVGLSYVVVGVLRSPERAAFVGWVDLVPMPGWISISDTSFAPTYRIIQEVMYLRGCVQNDTGAATASPQPALTFPDDQTFPEPFRYMLHTSNGSAASFGYMTGRGSTTPNQLFVPPTAISGIVHLSGISWVVG